MSDLVTRLTDKGIELNNAGQFALRDLIREARNALLNMKHARDNLDELLAVLVLEYHDQNWLSGDNKTRNEAQRALVEEWLLNLGERLN